jgi:hypothetical protein
MLHNNIHDENMNLFSSMIFNSINDVMIDYCKKYIMEKRVNEYDNLWIIKFVNDVEHNYIINNLTSLTNIINLIVDESMNYSIEFNKRMGAFPWKEGHDELINLTPAIIIDEILFNEGYTSFPFTQLVMKYKHALDKTKIFFPQKHNNYLLEKYIEHFKKNNEMFYNDFVNMIKHVKQIK